MFPPARFLFGLLLFVSPTAVLFGQQPAVHRYSFSNANGPLANGTQVLDSIGTAHGVVRGAGASATGSGVRLPGGSSATAAYIDLPNGVASGKDQSASGYANVTYEAWLTVHSAQNWSRIFDFGTNSSGEITAPGGVFTGTDYLTVTANIGTALDMRIERLSGGTANATGATTLGSKVHMVTTYDTASGAWKCYKNGGLIGTVTTVRGPSTIPDVNVWLGRSNYSGDNNADITFDEFSMYSSALTAQEISAKYVAGMEADANANWIAYWNGPATVPAETWHRITVDPATPITTGTGNLATEFNTADNMEGWTLFQATGSVSGGVLQATTTGEDSSVILSNQASGPDLDLGWNDFLELRIKVPASYTGGIRIGYGVSYTPFVDPTRAFTIPSAAIPKDGAFHTYRIDVGLVAPWRSNLRDLRIDPVDGAGSGGMTFAIDYIRVGDEPNAVVYNDIYTAQSPAAGGVTPTGALVGPGQTVYSMSSKRFRFLWNDAVAALPAWTADMAHGTLRNCEETWQVHARKLGYREPCFTFENPTGGPTTSRGKLNVSTWHSGYWAGGDWDGTGTRARFNATPDGIRVDPPSWVIPHEIMHDFQFVNNQNSMPSTWYEAHANYGRERWLEHYQFTYPGATSFASEGIRNAHIIMADGRDEYLKWTAFLYMDANPDNRPDLGEGTSAKIWQQNVAGQAPFNVLNTIASTTSMKNVFGGMAQHGATLNYPTRPVLRNYLSWDPMVTRSQYTDLVQRPDDPSWWRVPFDMAPMQGAYTIHELVVPNPGTAGRIVTVNFRPLPNSAIGADCRGGFTIVADDGTERYSTLTGNGSLSVTLGATENKLYFCVAGTPNSFATNDPDELICPYRSHPGKARFPYELQVTGATPRERNNGTPTGLVQHSNGGGWKATTANVAASAYIGPNARVYDTATVSGNARIEDYAVVQNNAQVLNNAVISGHGWVLGNAIVKENGKVRDWAMARDSAVVMGNGRALEHADLFGNYNASVGPTVKDDAVVKGSAQVYGGILSGNAIVDGDYFWLRDVGNSYVTGHLPYEGVPDSFLVPLPTGLYARYDFASAHDSRVIDQYGVTDSFTIGSPTWISADAKRSGFLSFNGSSQHVNLDPSLADMRAFTFTAWVKPLGGAANQAVLWMGASTTKRLCLTPDDGTGHAKFSIVNGGSEQTLISASALPVGTWSHVAVTLDGTTGTLYINGVSAATGAITIRPDQILAANTATSLQHDYLARAEGNAMPMFYGALDDVRFYSSALSAADMSVFQSATSVATAGTLHVDLRASDSSAGALTWTNNGTLGDFGRTGTPSKTTISGAPCVSFSGTSQAYTSISNTTTDIDGAGDRTIEVWANNPTIADEETLVSWGYRGSTRQLMALGFGSNAGWGAAAHYNDDIGWGGSLPGAGAWHHLAYTYDGSTLAKVYVDGVLAASKTLGGALNTFAAKPVNIGRQRNNTAGTSHSLYYSGYINSVRVHGGVLTPAQIAGNYSLGPVGMVNAAPSLAAISDLVLDYGTSSVPVPLTVGDADTTVGALALSGSAANATFVPAGNFSFSGSTGSRTALITPANPTGTSAITITVSDGAASASRTFNLTILSQIDTWRRQKFRAAWNTSIAADSADPDNDGLTNVLECAVGFEPNAASSAASQASIVNGRLTIAFTRNTAATDLILSVLAADNPSGTWAEIAQSANGAEFTDFINGSSTGAVINESGTGAVHSVQVSDVVLASDPSQPKRFLKLQVQH